MNTLNLINDSENETVENIDIYEENLVHNDLEEENLENLNIKLKNKIEKNLKIINFRINYWFHVISMKKHYPSRKIKFTKTLRDFYKMDEYMQIEILNNNFDKYFNLNNILYNQNKDKDFFRDIIYLYKINRNIIRLADLELEIH